MSDAINMIEKVKNDIFWKMTLFGAGILYIHFIDNLCLSSIILLYTYINYN